VSTQKSQSPVLIQCLPIANHQHYVQKVPEDEGDEEKNKHVAKVVVMVGIIGSLVVDRE